MPDARFRGDPYQVLDVAHHASDMQIKRRWRELAREHHPDRAVGDADEQARLTARMARINAAYDLLRDPGRRSEYDGSPQGRRARQSAAAGAAGAQFDE
jgi:molecular chaperone DnaJ